ncbi:unnamed protein product [Allacma fusca]|uniref:Uncharacterized protein n=1 Tax=Allacma fusca TaxID=39272 RepID=A0A8J2PDW7_9HEXA|nr:unnamed protein product [Allacma fusca]
MSLPYPSNHASLKYSRSASDSTRRCSAAREDLIDMSDDDYQQIPIRKGSSSIATRSQSAPPRRPPKSSAPAPTSTQVRVYVHEEPRSVSSRSSPAPMSKSMEEAYLYGFVQERPIREVSSLGRVKSSHHGHTNNVNRERKPQSCESLISFGSNSKDSRKSSVDFDRRSVVTIRRAGSRSNLAARQHSWEGSSALVGTNGKQSLSTPQLSPDEFEGSSRSSLVPSVSMGNIAGKGAGIFDDDLEGGALHKAESFEGHEEAVRSIVAAVQETRTLQRKMHGGNN